MRSLRFDRNGGGQRAAKGDRHPTYAYCNGITKQKPAAVERFDFNSLFKAKITQAVPLSRAELLPINARDPRRYIQWQLVELHAREIPLEVSNCN
jgi:hypothetical protein